MDNIKLLTHDKEDAKVLIGKVVFFVFFLVVMIDPTNTILHKKDICFVLTTAYCLFAFKPDFSKIPYIAILFCCVALPWIFSEMRMHSVENADVLAVFKSISPSLLLIWTYKIDLTKVARGPVVICCTILSILFLLFLFYPNVEEAVWLYMINHNEPIMMTHRYFFGIKIFGMYLKSTVSFIFVVAFYIHCLFCKDLRSIRRTIYLVPILIAFTVSGTRSTILLPFFLLCVIAFIDLSNHKMVKRLLYPLVFIGSIAFIALVIALAGDTTEASNAVKYAHIQSYVSLFEQHPLYMLIGQGPGSYFYSDGFNKIVLQTEWTYLELIRLYGIFAIGIIFVFFKPLLSLWKARRTKIYHIYFWSYLAYLLIAGTNPLLLSSTGMIMLLMAYSLEGQIKKGGEE